MGERRTTTCALCHRSYGAGFESTSGNDIWRARRMLRRRGLVHDDDGNDDLLTCSANDGVARVCVFCAQFVTTAVTRDCRRLDETRCALQRPSTTTKRAMSLVVRHDASASIINSVETLRSLPTDLNRILRIRPSTSSSPRATLCNLKLQQQREARTILAQDLRPRRTSGRRPVVGTSAATPVDRLRLLGPTPVVPPAGVQTRPYRTAASPVHHVKAGTLVQTTSGRFARLEVRWPAL
ncbi:hypothetical protein SPRG_02988 [Saprolegnia parasitica CBS 223.65]|uniref:Uncharacterized protein n=1 Tax=Saprolegnia parasitica (strain CBS 223.65) TaxID=695850 RepID=A0A067D146_SAPPC|nr:hypothetical protein SPRG_02988 [Saprolegnia parasitica CBS 223.65]KDO32511.1 hypothetical protein SPRG_02988 [Saprolegnia parasitica CBS 223.65]|eukprot:XP_012196960.1 hypothetical protein SPRG_02988 [Saprolegnia parasitica CBS 223.65]